MPVCTILPQRGKQENEADTRSKAKLNQSWLRASPIPRRSGRNTRRPGMGEPPARWKSPLARLCGINLLSLRWRSVGSSFAIHKESMSQWPCAVHQSRCRGCEDSWSGLSCAGRSRVTFHEMRAHLGVETQRQWADLAILRTTPALLGLISGVPIFAHHLLDGQAFPVRQAVWYTKPLPTFSDTLAFVRQHLWHSAFFSV